mmetsp:Transcript_26062/g.52363  ORF Transcript_26062/g.52363 Transcript_26062/m.52363 type:complete len:154 (-) Transcript_26062:1439-1900(-)
MASRWRCKHFQNSKMLACSCTMSMLMHNYTFNTENESLSSFILQHMALINLISDQIQMKLHLFASIATVVNINMKFSSITAIIGTFSTSSALCPQGFEIPAGLEGETHASWVRHSRRLAEVPPPPEPTTEYIKAVATLDIDAVKEDLKSSRLW